MRSRHKTGPPIKLWHKNNETIHNLHLICLGIFSLSLFKFLARKKKKVLAEKREEKGSFEIYFIYFKNHSSLFLVTIIMALCMWPESCWHQSWKILPHFSGAEMSKPDFSSPTFHRSLPPRSKPPKRQEQDFLSGFSVLEDPFGTGDFSCCSWSRKLSSEAVHSRKALSCQCLCLLLHHPRMT